MDSTAAFDDCMLALLGDEYGAFSAACGRPVPKAFRLNTLKAAEDDIEGLWTARVPWCPTGFYNDLPLGDSIEHFQGRLYIQDPVSMIAPELLAPTTEDCVLDMAAAPGGKSTHLAALMGNAGCLLANEPDRARLKALRFNLNRMGVANAVVTCSDAARLEPKFKFEKILLDAPCSNMGQLRDNPAAKATWNHRKVHECSYLQKRLIVKAADLLKEGGTLVYSTCTFAPEENEEVVDYAIGECGLMAQDIALNFKGRPGIREWGGKRYSSQVKFTRRIYPQDNDTGGFYVAALTK